MNIKKFSKSKIIKVLVYILLIYITILYTYNFRVLTDDELFNYGFATNIINGLIPYKDFNMIITPLFIYILSLILTIFGKKLIIYHIFIAILLASITHITSKKIGKYSLCIYLILLFYPYIGYNIFCLFLLFLLLFILDKEDNPLIEAIIISIMFLSKQIFIIFIIPSIILSKNKKKTISIYIISILLFLIYLLINNNLLYFINYCILGLLDFSTKNSNHITPLFLISIIIVIVLTIYYLKTKRKDILYILLFQIVIFPTVNYIHFIIGFAPVLYLLLALIKDVKFSRTILMTIISYISILFIIFNVDYYKSEYNLVFSSKYPINNFMKDRLTNTIVSTYVFEIGNYIKNNNFDKVYILGNFSYLIKLNNNLPINKYDIINNGNMGYKGYKGYLEEINKSCNNNSCLFIISDEEIETKRNIQTNREILIYIKDNYYKEFGSNTYSIYYKK